MLWPLDCEREDALAEEPTPLSGCCRLDCAQSSSFPCLETGSRDFSPRDSPELKLGSGTVTKVTNSPSSNEGSNLVTSLEMVGIRGGGGTSSGFGRYNKSIPCVSEAACSTCVANSSVPSRRSTSSFRWAKSTDKTALVWFSNLANVIVSM